MKRVLAVVAGLCLAASAAMAGPECDKLMKLHTMLQHKHERHKDDASKAQHIKAKIINIEKVVESKDEAACAKMNKEAADKVQMLKKLFKK
jgi:hypothetical protein